MIAATAETHSFIVVTRKVRDFGNSWVCGRSRSVQMGRLLKRDDESRWSPREARLLGTFLGHKGS